MYVVLHPALEKPTLASVCDFISDLDTDMGLDLEEKEKYGVADEDKKEKDLLQPARRRVLRIAGEEWLLPGPCTYLPRIEVEVKDLVHALVVKPDQAIHLRATTDFVDSEVPSPGLHSM